MKRRSFFAAIAAFFAPKPTTTLVAAGPECSTVAMVPAVIDADTPFLILCEEISMAEFIRRYPERIHHQVFIQGDPS